MDTHLNRGLFSSTFIRLAACAVLSAGFFPMVHAETSEISTAGIMQQSRTVTGKVLDPKGETVIGANVYEQERAVELMFEGQRFFDLRRWKRMEEAYAAENCPTAMKIYKLADGTLLYTHNTTVLQQRNFREAMYWMPVPRYELNKCPQLDGLPYEE